MFNNSADSSLVGLNIQSPVVHLHNYLQQKTGLVYLEESLVSTVSVMRCAATNQDWWDTDNGYQKSQDVCK